MDVVMKMETDLSCGLGNPGVTVRLDLFQPN